MDAFVTSTPQKKHKIPTLHDKEIEKLRTFVAEGRNVFVCGATGTGKTFVVDSVLNSTNCVEIQADNIPTSLYKNARTYTLIDGYDAPIKRLMIEEARRLVVTSTHVHVLPNFEVIVMPRRSPEVLATLAPNSYSAAVKSGGNIRNFFDYINNSDDKDLFETTSDIVSDILCTPGVFDLSKTIHEHGHVCDIIHGNYLSTECESYASIIDALSVADTYDTRMYRGDWDLLPYYVASGIASPKLHLGSNLKPENIKPGSSWSKYGNFKMRQQKLKFIQTNNSLGIEELAVIRKYAATGDLNPAVAYGIRPGDFDVMNHIALCNKMRPVEIVRIKKKLLTMNNELRRRDGRFL